MNIVVLNSLWRYPNSNRWDYELVVYENLFCHVANCVTYIVSARGRSAITAPEGSFRLFELDDLNDIGQLTELLTKITKEMGAIDRLVAFSESQLTIAAALRERFSIPGLGIRETEVARNKVKMKHRITSAGLRSPKYLPLGADTSEIEVFRFIDEIGYPVILKPVDGASSVGVEKLCDRKQLLRSLNARSNDRDWELEEFIAGDVFHVDGLADCDGKLRFCVASKYINNCMDFSFTSPLGGVMLPRESELTERLTRFAAECVIALEFRRCPFHLEVFKTDDDELVFLEIGARAAGADVPYMIEHSTGVNLFRHWADFIMHGDTVVMPAHDDYGAWLMFGLPNELPREVAEITDFEGKVNSLYRQFIPEVGSQLIKEGGYCSLQSGRFLFSHPSHQQLTRDVRKVLEEFRIVLGPCLNCV